MKRLKSNLDYGSTITITACVCSFHCTYLLRSGLAAREHVRGEGTKYKNNTRDGWLSGKAVDWVEEEEEDESWFGNPGCKEASDGRFS